MKFKLTDHKLYFTRGTASTKVDGQKIPVDYIYYNDPNCGYYVDPRGFLVLPNFNSVSGDIIDRQALYIVDGAIKIDTITDAIAEIKSYCENAFVNATGASITGCDSSLTHPDTLQLTGVVTPSNASQAGTWTSSNTAVATVSSSGLVTTVGAGEVTITFTSNDGDFTGTCAITVTA